MYLELYLFLFFTAKKPGEMLSIQYLDWTIIKRLICCIAYDVEPRHKNLTDPSFHSIYDQIPEHNFPFSFVFVKTSNVSCSVCFK